MSYLNLFLSSLIYIEVRTPLFGFCVCLSVCVCVCPSVSYHFSKNSPIFVGFPILAMARNDEGEPPAFFAAG